MLMNYQKLQNRDTHFERNHWILPNCQRSSDWRFQTKNKQKLNAICDPTWNPVSWNTSPKNNYYFFFCTEDRIWGFSHASWVLCHRAIFLDHSCCGYAREQSWFSATSTRLLNSNWASCLWHTFKWFQNMITPIYSSISKDISLYLIIIITIIYLVQNITKVNGVLLPTHPFYSVLFTTLLEVTLTA